MPTYSDKFRLPKPLGNENFTREKYNELIDAIDLEVGNALDEKSDIEHTHPAAMIVEDSEHQFVTAAEKAIINAPKPTWITPTMQNGWESRGFLGYTKLNDGTVVFRGGFIGGTNGLAAFTLPAAYRPINNRYIVVGDATPNGTLYILTIESSGIVRVNRTAGTGTLAYIDGVAIFDDAGV